MKMYIQPNKLSHDVGLILVVILFDTFFISWNYHKYCKISQNVAFWVSNSNAKKKTLHEFTYDGLVNLLVFSALELIQKVGYQQLRAAIK